MLRNPLSPSRLWAILAVVWLAYMLSFFHRFAPSSIATYLIESLSIPSTQLGLLAGSYFFVYTLMQVPTGVILDAVGPRALLLVGGVLSGLGSLMFGWASVFELSLVARILVGLGVSVTFLSMLKVYALTFPENRFSTMVGLGLLLGNLGSVLAGSPLAYLAHAFDWRLIFIVLGVVSLMLGGLAWWAIPAGLLISPTKNRHEEKIKLAERLSWAWQGFCLVVCERRSWPPSLINGGMAGCFFGFGGLWLSPWLIEVQGLSKIQAGWIGTLYFLSFALGALILGRLSDAWQKRKLPMLMSAMVHLLIFILLFMTIPISFNGLVLVFVVLGCATSGFTLSWANIKEINLPALSGTSTSVANMCGFLMGGSIQWAFGWVLDNQGDGFAQHFIHRWQAPMLIFVLSAGMALIAAWRTTETGAKNIYTPRQ